MNPELITRIQQLIDALTIAKKGMVEGSSAFVQLARSIDILNSALANSSGAANLRSLEGQLNKFYDAVQRGENIRLRMGQGNRLSTGIASQAIAGLNEYTDAGKLSEYGRMLRISALQASQKTPEATASRMTTVFSSPEQEEADLAKQNAAANKRQREIISMEESLAKERARQERKIQAEYEQDQKQRIREQNAREEEMVRLANENVKRINALRSEGYQASILQQRQLLEEYNRSQDEIFRQRGLANVVRADAPSNESNRIRADLMQRAQADAEADRVFNQQLRQRIAQQQRIFEEQKKQQERMEAARQAAMTPERLALSLPSGEFGATAAINALRQIDPRFTVENMKVVTEASTGISRVTASYRDVSGSVNQATVSVDKFGKVLVDSQKRFRNFADNVARDVIEVAKWSIAVAAIYGPMQKFSELIGNVVDLEFKLSDVSVVLTDSTKSTDSAFQDIFNTAQKTGESILGVTDAYIQAYRAAGGAATQAERFANAESLLTSAITLSKLTGIEQTTAIDTLSAALRQAYGPEGLGKGEELLNKWIRTSRIANVDLATLADGFSVVGETALDAGLSVDQLNAIIASVAETSSFSGKEVANATKAIIASFQSEATKKQLDILGIAYEDLDGKARSFLDIANEINSLSKQGIITPEQMSALTLAQGGGPRRQPIVAAFYASMEKIPQIAEESAKANANTGESFDAIQKKMDNVRTASEKLNNIFIKLAENLGTKGGLLDYSQGLINSFGGIVNIFASIAEVGGRAVPILMAIGGAMYYISRQTEYWKQQRLESVFVDPIANLAFRARQAGGNLIGEEGLTNVRSSARFGNTAASFARQNVGIITAVGAAALPAISNTLAGNYGQAAGNAIGGAIGTVLTKSPLGAIIGATIGESFVNAVVEFKPTFTDLFSTVFTKPQTPGQNPPGAKTADQLQQEAADKALTLLGSGSKLWGQVRGFLDQTMLNAAGGLFGGPGFQGVNQSQAVLIALESVSQDMDKNTKAQYDGIIKLLQEAEALRTGRTATTQQIAQTVSPDIVRVQQQFQEQLRNMLASGIINPSKYQQGQTNISGFNVSAPKFLGAFGGNFGTTEEALQAFGQLQAFGDTTTISTLNTYAEQINSINEKLTTMSTTDKDYTSTLSLKNDLLAQSNALLKEQLIVIGNMQKLLTDVNLNKYTKSEGDLILERARKITKDIYDENVKVGQLTQQQADIQLANLDKLLVHYLDGIKVADKVTAQAIQDAKAQLLEEGAISNREQTLGFSRYDLTQAQFNSMIGMNQNAPGFQEFINQLTSLGYKEDKTEQIAILNDGTVKPVAKDWKLVEYYLNEIMKINQKQLDGMFNLPEGWSFWIPYNAAKYGVNQTGNTTTTGGVPSQTTTTTTTPPTNTPAWQYYQQQFYQAQMSTWSKLNSTGPRASQAPAQLTGAVIPFTNSPGVPTNPLFDFFMKLNQFLNGGIGTQFGAGIGKINQSALVGKAGGAIGVPEVRTNLNLNINSSFQVNLNQQVLAKAIKQILTQDLLSYGNSSTTLTKTVVI